MTRFLGVDFSGGAAPWRPAVKLPTVWIAVLDGGRLSDLRPVQTLQGSGLPFDRLTAFLSEGAYDAAAIDAPFSMPHRHVPNGDYLSLVRAVAAFANAPDRPFPRGASLLDLAKGVAGLQTAKPLRETEALWKQRGVNVRSTLWNGPRGGAPFAVACLALIARARRPIWPWATAPGMLVEAFPAAQLRQWSLPFAAYSKPEQTPARHLIVEALKFRLKIPESLRDAMLSSADAIDAVLAAFAAKAAAEGQTADAIPAVALTEGAISVSA